MVGTPFGMSVGYAVGRFVEARKQAGNQRLRMGTEFPTLKGLTVRRSRRFNETAMLVPWPGLGKRPQPPSRLGWRRTKKFSPGKRSIMALPRRRRAMHRIGALDVQGFSAVMMRVPNFLGLFQTFAPHGSRIGLLG
ncbi:hypothetical protein LM247_14080 [Pseudomonas aeruginosa]|uniref:hypothetical protein n=1 Tax=Pseudomonas aeruginosa TaxID=287 RepID=UPI002148B28C|nr:hypothetical protein [Pseudomonas aeruginosa]MCQ9768964.1 hypothetical protein [Pseudomonas aeruginosa]